MYKPDNWVILKILNKDKLYYKVLAGWSGSYLYGTSWRTNSGITKVEKDGDYFLFYGTTDSVYRCHKDSYCLRSNNAYIYDRLVEYYGNNVSLMSEGTNWETIDWRIT